MRNILIAGLLAAVAVAALAPFDLFATEEGTPTPAPVQEFKPSGVVLIDAGAEPRAPLRYKFDQDIKEAMVMDMTISMTMDMGGFEQPANLMPTIRMVMELAGQEITEEGNLKYGINFTKAEVIATEDSDPAVVEAMNMGVGEVVGLTGWAIVDNRGVTLDMGFIVPEDANPLMVQQIDQMRGQLNQLSAPFPVEAVGVGAQWKVTQHINTTGMSLSQVATYTLTESLGDSAKMSVSLKQTAPAQRIENPSLPPGTTARITYLESEGSGDVALDLGRLVPESSMSMKMNMNMEISIEAPDMPPQSMPMSMKMDVQMKIRPVAVTETVGPSDEEPEDGDSED